MFSSCNTAPVQESKSVSAPLDTEPVYQISAVDKKPTPRVQVAPHYPFELMRKGIPGSAQIDFIVEVDGTVSNVKIENATHKQFGIAAAQCVAKWKFKPGLKDGQPVRVRSNIPIMFTLGYKSH